MYFPILRSRQYELLAIRELVEKNLLSEKICPVIEPVKASKTLIKTLGLFQEKRLPICTIINPQYGTLLKDLSVASEESFVNDLEESFASGRINLIFRLDSSDNKDSVLDFFSDKKALIVEYLLIDSQTTFADSSDSLESYRFVIHPDERPFRRGPQWKNRIVLYDTFTNYPRNADYAKQTDEFFTDWHRFYSDDGYQGFSDYTIVGNNYSEAGFAPRAVAIHMVYPDKKKDLRIRHFVSDSNDNISDTAGKFGEALSKLINCAELRPLNTYALHEFYRYYAEKKYPGLGVIKKLSIMHHFELMNRFLETGDFCADL